MTIKMVNNSTQYITTRKNMPIYKKHNNNHIKNIPVVFCSNEKKVEYEISGCQRTTRSYAAFFSKNWYATIQTKINNFF